MESWGLMSTCTVRWSTGPSRKSWNCQRAVSAAPRSSTSSPGSSSMSQSVSVRHCTTGCERPNGKRMKPPALRWSMSGALPEVVYFAIASRTSGGSSSKRVAADGGARAAGAASGVGCAWVMPSTDDGVAAGRECTSVQPDVKATSRAKGTLKVQHEGRIPSPSFSPSFREELVSHHAPAGEDAHQAPGEEKDEEPPFRKKLQEFDTHSFIQSSVATHTPKGLRCRWSRVSSVGAVSVTWTVASHCDSLTISPPLMSRSVQRARYEVADSGVTWMPSGYTPPPCARISSGFSVS